MFYVSGGNFNCAAYKNEPGSYIVFSVDLSKFDGNDEGEVDVQQICTIPEAGLLNGMEHSPLSNEILIADSEAGCVWKVDVENGTYEKGIEVKEMKAPAPPGMAIGVNGVKVRDGWVYWTNTGERTFCRVGIHALGQGGGQGEVEVLVRDVLVDDFCFDGEGNVWLATNILNTVAVVRVGEGWVMKGTEKEVVTVVGSEDKLTVAGGTACQFGRKKGEDGDEHVLYLVTTGGLAAPIKGSEVEGGKLIGVDTRSFDG